MKQSKTKLVFMGVLALGLILGAAICLIFMHSSKQFAEPDRKLTDGSILLCSDYANLCFTRPADWERSDILHAGLVKANDIEINPPSGTILRVEAIGSDTNTVCPGSYKCNINTVSITPLKNGLSVVAGVFDTVSSDPNVTAGHTPFVQLVSSHDVQLNGLQAGKSTAYTSFNPGVSFDNAPKVILKVSPGKGFDSEKAQQWLSSTEGNTAKQVLASVRSR